MKRHLPYYTMGVSKRNWINLNRICSNRDWVSISLCEVRNKLSKWKGFQARWWWVLISVYNCVCKRNRP